MTLDMLKVGESAVIGSVDRDEPSLRKHLLDMGLTAGAEVTVVKKAPMGDPIEIQVRGYSLAIRRDNAAKVFIRTVHSHQNESTWTEEQRQEHARNFDDRIFRPVPTGDPIPENRKIAFALVGNQNSGKTTLFNQLTGSNQHVGNFPGVTIDRKDGEIRDRDDAVVTDLPGIYSLSPYTSEEIVSRDFILKEHPDGLINIIDAGSLERSLYLTLQLMELQIPMVIALNMMDEVRKNGIDINIEKLETTLGVPVVPISAVKNEGIDELTERAVSTARRRECPGRPDFFLNWRRNGGALKRCAETITDFLENRTPKSEIPSRFAAMKIIEGDELIEKELRLGTGDIDELEHLIAKMEDEMDQDRTSAVADMRFRFIERACRAAVTKPSESIERIRSIKADKILTGKYTALPFFILIMGIIFWLTFSVIGTSLSDLMEAGIDRFAAAIDTAFVRAGVNEVVHSLVTDGIIAGVGSVLSFLPIIALLFLFLSILEDSGYMARTLGLSGKSFVPMLIGFGCSVPAIMATRTIPSERDKKMTIMLVPFMSCSAKLPIYMMMASVFFPKNRGLLVVSLYMIGITVGILFAAILKNTVFRGEPDPFIMELPNYRLPSVGNVARLIWDKVKDFITRAFTIIFVSSIIIWFLQTFDVHFNIAADPEKSLLAAIGGFIAPVFAPLRLNDWRLGTALMTGFMAKESVVSTLTVLLGGSTAAISRLLTPMSAFVFLVFSLLYTPCVAAIASVRRELGGGWAAAIVVMQCVVAWLIAFIVFIIGSVILRIA